MPVPNTSLRISLVVFKSVLSQLNPCGHYQTFLFELHTWWIVFEPPGILLLLLGSWKPFPSTCQSLWQSGKISNEPIHSKRKILFISLMGPCFSSFSLSIANVSTIPGHGYIEALSWVWHALDELQYILSSSFLLQTCRVVREIYEEQSAVIGATFHSGLILAMYG